MQLGTETSVDTEELLVHDRRQRQGAKRFDACLVDALAVFVFALELESEVVRQMPTFVVTPQEPERIRIPDLESPEIQDTL